MKLIFFLIAFCLVSIRYYFSWSGKDREKKGLSESNMVIKSNNFYEEINYLGKFQLSDDETSFKSISPGGYFKFRLNDIKIKAESNLRGEIDYSIYDGKYDLPMNEKGKLLVAQAVKEMIAWGYDANERMERVYHKGGAPALLHEVDSLKQDWVRTLYLNRLFAIDSLQPNYLTVIIKKVGSIGSDQDKIKFLTRITPEQLKNPQTDSAYFEILEGIGSDMDKVNTIQLILDQDSVTESNTERLLILSGRLGSDMDKANIFRKMIDKGLLKDSLYDHMLDLISAMGSDMDKTNLLVYMAQKMPKSEALTANYQKAAKTIGNDGDFGRAMRAIER